MVESVHLYIAPMSNPALDILEQQRQLVASLRAQLAQAETQLEGMEMIFHAMPTRRRSSPSAPRDPGAGGGSGGRQPGAISMRWRQILGEFYTTGKPFSPQDVADAVQRLEDRQMKPSEARRILDNYVAYDYVSLDPFGLFTVTDQAAQKFEFTRNPVPPPPVPQVSATVPPAPVIAPPQAFAAPAPPAPQNWGTPAASTWVPPAPVSAGGGPAVPPTYIGQRSPFGDEKS